MTHPSRFARPSTDDLIDLTDDIDSLITLETTVVLEKPVPADAAPWLTLEFPIEEPSSDYYLG